MGGASRSEKRRRQEAAQRLAAASIRVPPKRTASRTPWIVVAVVVAVAAVVGVTVWQARGPGEEVAPTYTATASGAVITAGTGPVAVDVYADYLCPQCERFEERYGNELTVALNDGRITVRQHAVAILDSATEPAGYSTRAANAASCAASAGVFPAYQARLFDEQPAEGGPGLSDEQLVAFGTELGARGGFAECVLSGANSAAVAAETEAAASDPALLSNGRFGTPTVAVDGAKVDISDPGWLQDGIAAGR